MPIFWSESIVRKLAWVFGFLSSGIVAEASHTHCRQVSSASVNEIFFCEIQYWFCIILVIVIELDPSVYRPRSTHRTNTNESSHQSESVCVSMDLKRVNRQMTVVHKHKYLVFPVEHQHTLTMRWPDLIFLYAQQQQQQHTAEPRLCLCVTRYKCVTYVCNAQAQCTQLLNNKIYKKRKKTKWLNIFYLYIEELYSEEKVIQHFDEFSLIFRWLFIVRWLLSLFLWASVRFFVSRQINARISSFSKRNKLTKLSHFCCLCNLKLRVSDWFVPIAETKLILIVCSAKT